MDWYARYPAKYDRKTLHLSLAEHGAYCRLIDYYMMTEQPLPDDDAQIAAVLRCPVDHWMSVAPKVRAYFEARDGSLHQDRCDEELTAQKSIGGRRAAANRANGKKGGRPRKNASSGNPNKPTNNPPETHGKPNSTLGSDGFPENANGINEQKPIGLSPKTHENPHTDRHTDSYIEDDKSSSHPIDDQKLFEQEFEETFWPAFPIRQGKQPALKAFTKARRKVSLQTIMDGLNRYNLQLAEPRAPSPKYAQGWLSDARWTDEPASNLPFLNGQSNGHTPPSDDYGHDAELSQWRARMKGCDRLWLDGYGPRPGQPGCRVPAEILREFGQ